MHAVLISRQLETDADEIASNAIVFNYCLITKIRVSQKNGVSQDHVSPDSVSRDSVC